MDCMPRFLEVKDKTEEEWVSSRKKVVNRSITRLGDHQQKEKQEKGKLMRQGGDNHLFYHRHDHDHAEKTKQIGRGVGGEREEEKVLGMMMIMPPQLQLYREHSKLKQAIS